MQPIFAGAHEPGEVCCAVFERRRTAFDVKETRPLSAMQNEVAALLARYGKSLSVDM